MSSSSGFDDVDMFSRWCIEKKYLLTALELHQELNLRNDREPDVLKDFVKSLVEKENDTHDSRPSSSEAPPPTTPGILETTVSPFSSRGGVLEMIEQREDRISILEHDLVCTRRDLAKSRQQLKQLHEVAFESRCSSKLTGAKSCEMKDVSAAAVASVVSVDKNGDGPNERTGASDSDEDSPATLLERGLLNCIVKKYLVDAGYKLSSMTFADEVRDQNLDRLEDYGLHIGNRADLLALYRSRIRPVKSAMQLEDEIVRLRSSSSGLEKRASEAVANATDLRERFAEMSRQYQAIVDAQAVERRETAELRLSVTNLKQQNARLHRKVQEFDEKIQMRAGGEKNGSEESQLFDLLCRQLPHVAGGMVISKRMALVPLIVRTISLLPRPAPALIATLCSLVPRPDYDEQEEMSAVLCTLAANMGPERTANELVQEIVGSQITHRFKERRIQAALLCRTLCAHCPLHTIVQTTAPALVRLATHESEGNVEVREEAIESLGAIMKRVLSSQESVRLSIDILRDIRNVLLTSLIDEEPSVSEAAQTHVLGPLVFLEDIEGCLFSKADGLVSSLIDRVRCFMNDLFGGSRENDHTCHSKSDDGDGNDDAEGRSRNIEDNVDELVARAIIDSRKDRVAPLLAMKRTLRMLVALAPKMFERLVRGSSSPATARASLGTSSNIASAHLEGATRVKSDADEDEDDDSVVANVLDAVLLGASEVVEVEEALRWPALKILCSQFVPDLLFQLSRARLNTRDGEQLRGLYEDVITSLCRSHGVLFTKRVVRPLCLAAMGVALEKAVPSVELPSATFLRVIEFDRVEDDDDDDATKREKDTTTTTRPFRWIRFSSFFLSHDADKDDDDTSPSRSDIFERIAPIYVRSVLLTIPTAQTYVSAFLRQSLLDAALEQNGSSARQYPTVERMFTELPVEFSSVALGLLDDLATHTKPAIRVKVTDLLAGMLIDPSVVVGTLGTTTTSSILSLASDDDVEVRKRSVKAVLALTCGNADLSATEAIELHDKLQDISLDPSHSVVLNVLRALVRFNQQCDTSFRNVQIVAVVACVCRRVVRIAQNRGAEKRLWSHSENAEVATALISTVQAVWQYLLPAGQKELTVPLSQFMRTGEKKGLLDPIFMSMLEMIIPQLCTSRQVGRKKKDRSKGALAGVLKRMSAPGSPDNLTRPDRSNFDVENDDDGEDSSVDLGGRNCEEEDEEGGVEEEEDNSDEEGTGDDDKDAAKKVGDISFSSTLGGGVVDESPKGTPRKSPPPVPSRPCNA